MSSLGEFSPPQGRLFPSVELLRYISHKILRTYSESDKVGTTPKGAVSPIASEGFYRFINQLLTRTELALKVAGLFSKKLIVHTLSQQTMIIT